jgi:glyoxylase-like metal-dependent hydrolase (beta-lactamase superfamily II)
VSDAVVTVDVHYLGSQIAACHLLIDNGRAAFVDCGISSSVPYLLTALDQAGLGPEQVDWVCPTHVHLDHAGGAGQLMRLFPNATCVVHPRGARHLVDPSKLIAGSVAVYGEARFRQIYGDVLAIDSDRVLVVEDAARLKLGQRDLEFIHTEGHAKHHYCVLDHEQAAIVSGDILGIAYPCFDTDRGAFVFATTTPIQFDLEAWLASLQRIEAYGLEAAYLTHFGCVTSMQSLFSQLRRSLADFAALARDHADALQRADRMQAALFELLCRRLDEHGDTRSEAARHALLDMDIELNVMGLEVWLDRVAA